MTFLLLSVPKLMATGREWTISPCADGRIVVVTGRGSVVNSLDVALSPPPPQLTSSALIDVTVELLKLASAVQAAVEQVLTLRALVPPRVRNW
ncbi:hypothetical protein D3C78_1486190 [compost metagenome]